MSQAGIVNVAGGGGGGSPVQTLTGNSGGAVPPTANNINVLGDDSTTNNNNGITTIGDAGTSTLTVTLTNRLQGQGSTVGAVTADIITFPLTTVGTYSFEFQTSAYNTTSLLGAGYQVFGAVRFDGVSANVCGSADTIDNEEGAMTACDIDVVVSGANAILRVTGYAAQTINWGAVGIYTFRGA